MKRTLSTVALMLALIVPPSTAFAVSVSSTEGTGTQTRNVTYGNGASTNGTLRTLKGFNVYYQGKVLYPQIGCADPEVGRYTENTASRTAVTRRGDITSAPGIGCTGPDVQARVARDVALSPDPVGSWSSAF